VGKLSLIRAEPALAAGLSARQRRAAERRLQVRTVVLPAGSWRPEAEKYPQGFGYLLAAGMLLRRIDIENGRSVELLAKGDCLFPWREEAASFSRAEWQVIERATLAPLDLRPGSDLSRLPTVSAMIAARATDRSRRLALQSATMSIVGIEHRLRALLWVLAEQWGRVVSEGVELRLDVPQDVLAAMVGARRPTVSMALSTLDERGQVVSVAPGCWLLKGEPPTPLDLESDP
jgi:hypothetical protein